MNWEQNINLYSLGNTCIYSSIYIYGNSWILIWYMIYIYIYIYIYYVCMLNVPNMIGISISPKLNRLANARLVEGAAQNSAQQRNATTQKDGSWSYLTSSHIYIYINMVIYIYGYLYIYISCSYFTDSCVGWIMLYQLSQSITFFNSVSGDVCH